MNDTYFTLLAARILTSHPDERSIHAYARDDCGDSVLSTSRHAVRWCALGAIHAVAPNAFINRNAREALGAAAKSLFNTEAFRVSDKRSRRDVNAMFDVAMATVAEGA